MSLIEHQAAPPARRAAKPERISPKVRDACDLLAAGQCKTITEAAAATNLSREHLSRMLGKPHVQAFLTREARRTIATAQLGAAQRVVELMRAESEHVSLDASKHVLGIAGISPPERAGVVINNNVAPGYVINLGDGASPVQSSTIDGQAIDNADAGVPYTREGQGGA